MYKQVWTVGPRCPHNGAFGEFLMLSRQNVNLSRAEAARKLGFTSEYLRLIERGKRTPALGNMHDICTLYNISCSFVTNRAVFEHVIVEFTSRILEARGKPRLRDNVGRTERIGQIVQNLDGADDETLEKIYSLLRRKRDTR